MSIIRLTHTTARLNTRVSASQIIPTVVEGGPYMTLPDNTVSFGALLQSIRRRQHLTQQELADALGIHRRTLIRWEQGDYLPESKTMVLELARHLRLGDLETRHLLEASLTSLKPHWLVPLPRNPFFTGRTDILETLHAQLGANSLVMPPQISALHGLGGVGKTQIALEYAYRYALEYSAIFWIEAETDESIVASLLHIAEVLQLCGQKGKDQQHVVTTVQRWLNTHGKWLLIWDNIEDLDVLHRFLPAPRSGAIFITTRHRALGTLAYGLHLRSMEQEEGILFLLRRAKVLNADASIEQARQFAERMPEQYTAAAELVNVLGGLPLALDQAGTYLEETHCGLPAYLKLFHTRRTDLLQQRGNSARDHLASVSATFTLAITAMTQHDPVMRDLLHVCALLQPDAIPEELFRKGCQYLGPVLASACCDQMEWDHVVGMACSYSLLLRQSEGQTLSIHRLVQAVLLDSMTKAEKTQWNMRIIAALDALLPETLAATAYTARKQYERLLPHALLYLHRVATPEESLTFASLAYKMAQYLRACGRHAEAELLYQHALHIQAHIPGPSHHQVTISLSNPAILYSHQGKYTDEEPLYQRALLVQEHVLGSDYPDMAFPLHDLAELSQKQGKDEQAETL